jgi:hypothetical protein
MTNVHTLNVRPSDILLDRVFNPASDDNLGGATPAQLAEACGIIPDFFCQACIEAEPLTLDAIAAGMDNAYQFGGFGSYPYKGTVDDHNGTYQSEYEDDDALAPLARFIFEGFECFVYEYGIAAIRDRATRETKIARFD